MGSNLVKKKEETEEKKRTMNTKCGEEKKECSISITSRTYKTTCERCFISFLFQPIVDDSILFIRSNFKKIAINIARKRMVWNKNERISEVLEKKERENRTKNIEKNGREEQLMLVCKHKHMAQCSCGSEY